MGARNTRDSSDELASASLNWLSLNNDSSRSPISHSCYRRVTITFAHPVNRNLLVRPNIAPHLNPG